MFTMYWSIDDGKMCFESNTDFFFFNFYDISIRILKLKSDTIRYFYFIIIIFFTRILA